LDILGNFKKGYPFTEKFDDPFKSPNDDIEKTLEAEMEKMESRKKGPVKKRKKDNVDGPENAPDNFQRRDNAFRLMYKYLISLLGNSDHKEIYHLWKSKTITNMAKRYEFMEKYCKIYRLNGRPGLHIMEMIVRFLLVGCIYAEPDDKNHSYAHSFMTDMEQFIANNGRNWSSHRDLLRTSEVPIYMTNPVRRVKEPVQDPLLDPVEYETPKTKKKEMNEESKEDSIFYELYLKPQITRSEYDDLKLADGNKNTTLLVCDF